MKSNLYDLIKIKKPTMNVYRKNILNFFKEFRPLVIDIQTLCRIVIL